jgi:uncharacterized protein
MSTGLPARLDVLRLADQRARIDATVALAGLPRIAPLLAEPTGEARVSLVFGRDAVSRATVEGEVEATLALVCQRCLERVAVPVTCRMSLVVVTDEAAAAALPAEVDPLVVAGREIEAASLVEDELLLAVPVVPMHADAAGCGPVGRRAPDAEPQEPRRNPFAALAALKKRN